MRRLNKYKTELIGGAAGALGGYLYYYFIGCSSGSCSITSSPINSTLYGMVTGALIFSLFRKEKKSKNKNSDNKQTNKL